MKNFWKRLFYKICPSVFYSRGRTTNITVINFLNYDIGFPPDLYKHLKIVHPQKWFDDEVDALFFAIYDYITRTAKCKVILTRYPDNIWIRICIGNNKHLYQDTTLVKFGYANILCTAYRRFLNGY